MNIISNSELHDFFYFIRNPSTVLSKNTGWLHNESNFIETFSITNLVKWACLLWFLNILILGPLACSAAKIIGARHKIESSIPLFFAIVWAPIIEEMLFRYWMVSSIHVLLVIPFFIFILFMGPSYFTIASLVMLLAICFFISKFLISFRYPVIVKYNCFPALFHFSNIIFAILHINNFVFYSFNNWYLIPLLVLPQWCTSLVLGWIRLTKGILPSISLHSIFNAAPAIIIWFFLRSTSNFIG
ncbi:hypothetical protein CONE_0315 [Candidatus Kinetoplastibacterium oncopeltii TCC290E]|uniref:CPBP family intramembrane metalloprotease n=1 Tax=Candidatus Kinetoplastidibacterium stringomonadis TCC290E TaxID=1208920 RepID=M1LVL2_9PROT|nr:hypothetical protein [Candidatus Kinetoplastibacterium oncopeltii]AGF48126.1 hypothetical protein CONE_0315 [Candidatus Kinetoplastibacterium oncopeltii TCC290E]